MTKLTPEQMLDLRFDCGDLRREVSIRQYMQELLRRLYKEGEGFSGKRPFGNSGWEGDIAFPLVREGVISGEIEGEGEDAYLEDYDYGEFDDAIEAMISAL